MAEHVCPPWVGRLLANPVRTLFQPPQKILGSYIKEGMTVLEPGSAMGFFSLPAAKMVGSTGKVICIDLQKEMIRNLEKRATKAGLAERIETRVCSGTSLLIDDIKASVDFAFAIAVVHEVPHQDHFLKEIYHSLKPGSKFLFAEPKGHVKEKAFEISLGFARKHGFHILEQGIAWGGLTALLKKQGTVPDLSM